MISISKDWFVVALLLGVAGCGEEKGVCISPTGPVCSANYRKSSCDGRDDQYIPTATPAAAVAECRTRGFTRAAPSTNAAGSMKPDDVEKTLAGGGFVVFTKPFSPPPR